MISRKRKAVFILAFSFIFAFSIKDKSANAMSIPKKVTVNVGSTKTVKLNGNKSPFASWSVSNGKIRIVKMSKNSVKMVCFYHWLLRNGEYISLIIFMNMCLSLTFS